ncbi:MAG TPA: class I SAM-dependent methyltransferase, partial [Candidatus Baltobacteraceae bacterium]|nr:class I SAM-dependent methyltransferase [Candidatus Baltobacteraceae bacterium]
MPQLEQIARDLGRPHSIVDIGCGLGGVLRWMCERSSAAGIGIDYSPVAVDAARREHAAANLRFHVGTASATGIETSTCDGLVSIDVLQFTEPHSAVREIARVLQRGGRAAIRTWELREGAEV